MLHFLSSILGSGVMTMREEALDERSKKILRELVSLYCVTGEPVGSRTLSKKGKMGLSPATIRNVLSDLETLGYITQPHTSAGRIPTDKGYRFFVNHLLKSHELNIGQKEWIENMIPAEGDFEKILLLTTGLLSSLSHHIALAVSPKVDRMILQNIDFIRVSDQRVLAITITKGGVVSNKVIEMEEPMTQHELSGISNYLKSEFCGQTLPSIRAQIIAMMKQEQSQYDTLVKKAVLLSRKTLVPDSESEQLFINGASQIVNYPEFSDMSRTRELLEALEEKSKILKLLTECIEGEGTHVLIGSENKDPELQSLTLISSPYKYGNQSVGTVGILGPTRMEYGRVIPLVDHIAKVVSNILTRGN
jgi:heat-inducible transcriptional repressor